MKNRSLSEKWLLIKSWITMKNRLVILASLAIIAALVGIGAFGWFTDVETSNANTFSAGSLDLTLDEKNGVNVIKWTIGPMVPGNQPKAFGTFTLTNDGTIAGYLDMENISVTSQENDLIDPESDAGDNSDLEGELEDVLNLELFHDLNCNGVFDTDDTEFFNDRVGSIAPSYNLDIPIPVGESVCITGIFNWWSTPEDSQAMTDSFDLNISFELSQVPEE
jgi:predicted ribosomally synthesized peptide with SipW-like signal peptide